jgi:hypothetical protein
MLSLEDYKMVVYYQSWCATKTEFGRGSNSIHELLDWSWVYGSGCLDFELVPFALL